MAIVVTLFYFSSVGNTNSKPQQVFGDSKAISAHDLLNDGANTSTVNSVVDENDLSEPMWSGLIRNADLVIEADEVNLGRFQVRKLFLQEPGNSEMDPESESEAWICPKKPKIIDI